MMEKAPSNSNNDVHGAVMRDHTCVTMVKQRKGYPIITERYSNDNRYYPFYLPMQNKYIE